MSDKDYSPTAVGAHNRSQVTVTKEKGGEARACTLRGQYGFQAAGSILCHFPARFPAAVDSSDVKGFLDERFNVNVRCMLRRWATRVSFASSAETYFPMQKRLKMRSSRSSVYTAPTIAPNSSSAARNSSASTSGGSSNRTTECALRRWSR